MELFRISIARLPPDRFTPTKPARGIRGDMPRWEPCRRLRPWIPPTPPARASTSGKVRTASFATRVIGSSSAPARSAALCAITIRRTRGAMAARPYSFPPPVLPGRPFRRLDFDEPPPRSAKIIAPAERPKRFHRHARESGRSGIRGRISTTSRYRRRAPIMLIHSRFKSVCDGALRTPSDMGRP